MTSLPHLAGLMRELDEQLVVCMRCGLCQAVCPLYAQTGREADVARGKLALLDGLAKQLLDDPQAARERLERCLLCGSCAANCPSGVKVLDIFLKARAILAGYLGLSPAKRLVFRRFLAKPRLMNLLLGLAPILERAFTKPASQLLGTSCARLPIAVLGQRHFKNLAAQPLHQQVPSLFSKPALGQPRAAFFVGCLIDKIFPQVGQAALKALEHHGVGVFLPAGQACCGIPALSGGDSQAFASLLKQNLAAFPAGSFDYLLTACATCTATIKKLWPLMAAQAGLNAAELAQIQELAAKTLDMGQFLADRFVTESLAGAGDGERAVLTYHDPCHLKKSLGVFKQPRRLLQANPAYELKEMAEADWCCGMGGSFNLAHYQTSAAIGRRKLDNIRRSGASLVATSCPACMLQISDALSQSGEQIQVRHALEVYAQAL